MGLRPALRNGSQDVTPAQAEAHVREEVDSRSRAFAKDKLRRNDVTFDRDPCPLAAEESPQFLDAWGRPGFLINARRLARNRG